MEGLDQPNLVIGVFDLLLHHLVGHRRNWQEVSPHEHHQVQGLLFSLRVDLGVRFVVQVMDQLAEDLEQHQVRKRDVLHMVFQHLLLLPVLVILSVKRVVVVIELLAFQVVACMEVGLVMDLCMLVKLCLVHDILLVVELAIEDGLVRGSCPLDALLHTSEMQGLHDLVRHAQSSQMVLEHQ